MIRLDLHPRLRRRIRNFSASQVEAVESALEQLRQGFGHRHMHLGLGVRRLRRDLYECRAGLDLRILFWAKPGVITAFDVMTHDEIAAFLQNL